MPQIGLNQPSAGTSNAEVGFKSDDRQPESAFFASGTHFPQQVPSPRSRARSRTVLAPPLTALRI